MLLTTSMQKESHVIEEDVQQPSEEKKGETPEREPDIPDVPSP